VSVISIERFKIDVPEAVLDDLRERLERTRWSDIDPSGWDRGTNQTYMKDHVDHWMDHYDWREHEANLNRFDHYVATVDGVRIHFIHQRSGRPDAVPLLLIHGWPDSFYRYHKVIPLLTGPGAPEGPEISFDVVVPSIPGFGFSERRAMTVDAAADLFAKLMTKELGYERFVCGGGDLGFLIARSLAVRRPELVSALHLTEVGYPDQTTDLSMLSPEEREFASFIQEWLFKDGTYNMIQSTKPDSLAVGLNDSPAGLAAWIMNFAAIGMTGQEVDRRIPRDEMLTNIMIYWVTGTITSSVRWYYEIAHAPPPAGTGKRLEVPTAVAHMPLDAPLPRRWAERSVNLKHFTEMPRGGHFGAWELPELFAQDLKASMAEILGMREAPFATAGAR
jgi:pimeloyl-ACP methyl ester carboxylesterase